MAKFNVETNDLKNSALVLGDKNSSYTAAVGKLYAETTGLKVEWQGQSSEAFNVKVEGYRQSFEELAKIVTAYGEYLKTTAASYEATEQALTEAANKLAGAK